MNSTRSNTPNPNHISNALKKSGARLLQQQQNRCTIDTILYDMFGLVRFIHLFWYVCVCVFALLYCRDMSARQFGSHL